MRAKKRYIVVVLMMFIIGCSPYKQFNPFSSYSKVTSITVSEYKPLHSSTLPDLINTVTSTQDVKEMVSIINRAYDKNETISNEAIFSNPNLFDFKLGFEGENLPFTQLLIKIADEKVTITTLIFSSGNEQHIKVYELQAKDVEEFKGYLQ